MTWESSVMVGNRCWPAGGGRRPLIGLRSGYVLRGLDRFPRRGTRGPWALGHSYLPDQLADRLDASGRADQTDRAVLGDPSDSEAGSLPAASEEAAP